MDAGAEGCLTQSMAGVSEGTGDSVEGKLGTIVVVAEVAEKDMGELGGRY